MLFCYRLSSLLLSIAILAVLLLEGSLSSANSLRRVLANNTSSSAMVSVDPPLKELNFVPQERLLPSFAFIAPTRGSSMKKGASYIIRWRRRHNPLEKFPRVSMFWRYTSINPESSQLGYISASTPNSGSFDWTVPADAKSGVYRLRLCGLTPKTGANDEGIRGQDFASRLSNLQPPVFNYTMCSESMPISIYRKKSLDPVLLFGASTTKDASFYQALTFLFGLVGGSMVLFA